MSVWYAFTRFTAVGLCLTLTGYMKWGCFVMHIPHNNICKVINAFDNKPECFFENTLTALTVHKYCYMNINKGKI